MDNMDIKQQIMTRYYDKTIIYAFGDSHISFFGDYYREEGLGSKVFDYANNIYYIEPNITPFFPFHIGPALAYNLNKYGTKTAAREKIEYLINNFIPPNGRLLFCFGEIDIRVHVIKQSEKKKVPVIDIIENIVDNYMAFLKSLKGGHEIIVWGSVAQQSDDIPIDVNYPRYGSMISRNQATELYNKILKVACDENGFTFVSIFPFLVNENMETKGECYMDAVHISRKCWKIAKQEFEKSGIVIGVE